MEWICCLRALSDRDQLTVRSVEFVEQDDFFRIFLGLAAQGRQCQGNGDAKRCSGQQRMPAAQRQTPNGSSNSHRFTPDFLSIPPDIAAPERSRTLRPLVAAPRPAGE